MRKPIGIDWVKTINSNFIALIICQALLQEIFLTRSRHYSKCFENIDLFNPQQPYKVVI